LDGKDEVPQSQGEEWKLDSQDDHEKVEGKGISRRPRLRNTTGATLFFYETLFFWCFHTTGYRYPPATTTYLHSC
jgi:hypothetical protein